LEERREDGSACCFSERKLPVDLSLVSFIVGALVSLAFSWVLVTRLERVGERFGLSEALLGVVAALAADAPEITSSISAISQHQREIGSGVVIGSNLFNLAALLGLGAVVSGFIVLHRKVVVLGGCVAVVISLCCLLTTVRAISVSEGLSVALVVLICYLVVLGLRQDTMARLPIGQRFSTWLTDAVNDEGLELMSAIRPKRGRPIDVTTALAALVIVVVSSVAMERGATSLGHHFQVADAVIGGIVLAAVTSLPNAVSAIYLASKGRGAAAFSTALNSNNLNVVVGLLVPGVIVGLATPSFAGNFTSIAYVTLTVIVLAFAFAKSGLSRRAGSLILAGYVIFVACLLAM
jgi:cation:H+ antiporter